MIPQSIYFHYLSALLDGNKYECISIVEKLLEDDVPIKSIYVDLIQRSMYRIGHLWERQRASVASEHLATKISDNILSMMYPEISSGPKCARTIVVTCADKEFHELGARIISDYIEFQGWNSYYLGACTPKEELAKIVVEKQPDLVGVSVNLYMNMPRMLKMIEEIHSYIPHQQFIIGGQAFTHEKIVKIEDLDNVTYIPSLDHLENFLSVNFDTVIRERVHDVNI